VPAIVELVITHGYSHSVTVVHVAQRPLGTRTLLPTALENAGRRGTVRTPANEHAISTTLKQQPWRRWRDNERELGLPQVLLVDQLDPSHLHRNEHLFLYYHLLHIFYVSLRGVHGFIIRYLSPFDSEVYHENQTHHEACSITFLIYSCFWQGITLWRDCKRIYLVWVYTSRSTAAHLLRLWVRIPSGAWMFFCRECCVCFQVEVSATDWSPFQRSPTVCDASLCVIKKPWEWGG